jgi:PilZ domain
MHEHRQIPRYQVECPVTFVVEDVPGTGTVFNLSEEGCAIETAVGVPTDGYISLSITLPDDMEPVVVDLARVRWVTRSEFGCEFRILSRSARKRLERYLLRDRAA